MQKAIGEAYFSSSILKKEPHYHDRHQIILILKGTVQFCVNGTDHTATRGSILIFSRYENHSLSVLSREYERYVLQLDPAAITMESRIYALLTNRPEGFCNAIDITPMLPEMEGLFRRIMQEYQMPQPLAEDMQQLLVSQLLILLYRFLPQQPHFDEDLYALQRKLENHCGAQYTLSALAAELNISPSSLSHRFKKLTGSSVMEYLLICRIATAKRYLAETDLDVCRIVELCGFSDSSNFSRTFKNRCGLSPSAFRKQYKDRGMF